MKKAVVLLSGGLDSTTCLAIAKNQGFACYGLSFDYGQKHRAELAAAKRVAAAFGVEKQVVLPLAFGQLGGSALTDPNIKVPDFSDAGTIPVTYVPARNTTFLAIALGWAEILEAEAIFIGVSAVDYSGYPDCRPEFIDDFQLLANLASKTGVEGKPILIHTPLLYLSKAETIHKGLALKVDYGLTVSCYQATDDGQACGRCDSCELRKEGFRSAGVVDPTQYKENV